MLNDYLYGFTKLQGKKQLLLDKFIAKHVFRIIQQYREKDQKAVQGKGCQKKTGTSSYTRYCLCDTKAMLWPTSVSTITISRSLKEYFGRAGTYKL